MTDTPNPIINVIHKYAVSTPNNIAFRYGSDSIYSDITYCELYNIICLCESYYSLQCNNKQYQSKKKIYRRYIGIYAQSNVQYNITILTLMKLKFIPICISTRNSVRAVQHLMVGDDTVQLMYISSTLT